MRPSSGAKQATGSQGNVNRQAQRKADARTNNSNANSPADVSSPAEIAKPRANGVAASKQGVNARSAKESAKQAPTQKGGKGGSKSSKRAKSVEPPATNSGKELVSPRPTLSPRPSLSKKLEELSAPKLPATNSGKELSSPRPSGGMSPRPSLTGKQQIVNTQSMIGDSMTTIKIGGRPTSLHYPKDMVQTMAEASQDPSKVRQFQAAPPAELILEYAYGYNGNHNNNLHEIAQSTCVYSVGALGVVFDFENNVQRFFTGHTQEVTALTFCAQTGMVATGQHSHGSNNDPWISIWSPDEVMPIERRRLKGHRHAIGSLAFSADGKTLFSVDTQRSQPAHQAATSKSLTRVNSTLTEAKSSPILIYRISASTFEPRKGASVPINEGPDLQFSPLESGFCRIVPHSTDSQRAFAFSSNSACFLKACTDGWVSQQGNLPEIRRVDDHKEFTHFNCAKFILYNDQELVALGGNGRVFVLNGLQFVRSIPIVPGMAVKFLQILHTGVVTCGGEDGGISFLKPDLTGFERPRTTVTDHSGRPLRMNAAETFVLADGSDAMLVGTTRGRIVRLQFDRELDVADIFIAQQAPSSGAHSVAALCTSPLNTDNVAVADQAGLVHFFDVGRCQMKQMPPYQCESPVTCLAWGPHGHLLVAGRSDGHLEAILCRSWKHLSTKHRPTCGMLMLVTDALTKAGDASPVSAVRFSPQSGKYLACGCSISGNIHVYSVSRDNIPGKKDPAYYFEKINVLSGNATAILFLQFSNDESQLASNARDGQVLCWEMDNFKRITPSFPAESWFGHSGQTFQLTMSWPMIGIWNKATNDSVSTTALVAEANAIGDLAAVGDSDGQVRLYRFPAPLDVAEAKAYHGHSSKVKSIVWTNNNRVLSVGTWIGDGLLQWRLSTAEALTGDTFLDHHEEKAWHEAQNKFGEHDAHQDKETQTEGMYGNAWQPSTPTANGIKSTIMVQSDRGRSTTIGVNRTLNSSVRSLSPSNAGVGRLSPTYTVQRYRSPSPQLETQRFYSGALKQRPTLIRNASMPAWSTQQYSCRVCDTAGTELARAIVFLYHPPFALETAVSYQMAENGAAAETFNLPPGWGVLRSRCGMLIWLQLTADSPLASILACNLQVQGGFWGQWLSFELSTSMAATASRVYIAGRINNVVVGGVQLSDNEALLHPHSETNPARAQVRLSLDAEFGSVVKGWLSKHAAHF